MGSKIELNPVMGAGVAIATLAATEAAYSFSGDSAAWGWEAQLSASSECVPNSTQGEAFSDVTFINQEAGHSAKQDMNVAFKIGGKTVAEANDVKPGDPATVRIDLGSAPREAETVKAVETWTNRKAKNSDSKTAPIPAVKACPAPETTTTTTTSTTVPQKTGTSRVGGGTSTIAQNPNSGLAFTGVDVLPLSGTAILLVAAGIAMVKRGGPAPHRQTA